MQKYDNIVIVGATSAIAEHCARIWIAENPMEITLVGRNVDKLNLISADLTTRSVSTKVTTKTLDFLDVKQIEACIERCVNETSPDLVLIAHGSLPDQLKCQSDPTLIEEALKINAISPIIFAEGFANRMPPNRLSTIIVLGSVAGDRGRKSNYIYGSAKSLIEKYTQGLQHRFGGSKVNIILVKPGPTETPMTAHMVGVKRNFASVEEVAKSIVYRAKKLESVIYVPLKWAAIMLVIRNLPKFVFSKLDI